MPLPVPVESIAEDLLGLWVGERAELGASGMLIPARREIWVDAGEARANPARRRFTIAHEIGHWVCQARKGNARPVFCRSDEVGSAGEGGALEREANVFAAELLMPAPTVRVAARSAADPAELAAELGVSDVALAWRLFNLGITDHPPA